MHALVWRVLGAAAAAATLTMAWSAASLLPDATSLGRVAVPSVPLGAPAPIDEPGEYVERRQLVSEWLLLHQLARAFLSQPWLQPDAGQSRTRRKAPPGGWAFPLIGTGAARADTQPGGSFRQGEAAAQEDSQVGVHAESDPQRDFPANLPALSPLGEGSVPLSNVVLPAIDADTNNANVASDADDESDSDNADASDITDATGGERSTREAKPQSNGLKAAAGAAGSARGGAVYAVRPTGEEVAIEYVGQSAGKSVDGVDVTVGGRFLTLCNADWLCVSGWHARQARSRFQVLATLRPSGNGSRPRWFALRNVATGKVLQVAPPSDPEAWVVRARDPPRLSREGTTPLQQLRAEDTGAAAAGTTSLAAAAAAATGTEAATATKMAETGTTANITEFEVAATPATASNESREDAATALNEGRIDDGEVLYVSALELWRAGRRAVWNRGVRGMLNFRGIAAGDGVSLRAHGDVKPRVACTKFTRRTRFALRTISSGALDRDETSQRQICIALGISTRTRDASTKPKELPLLKVLLPSLLRTTSSSSQRFRFELHVGHDDDDPFWTRRTAAARAISLAKRSIGNASIALNLSQWGGGGGAPCFVWSSLLRRACDGGCDYFYQLNDDIKLVTPEWAEEFTETLRANSYLSNFGITGPLDTNNPRLMTQSFVHCTHRDAFGYYYPKEFRNWYSDDWATQVYGKRNTFWRRDLEVNHELAHQGPRYAISYEDKAQLQSQVEGGRRILDEYVTAKYPGVPGFLDTQIDAQTDAVDVPD